MHKLEVIMAAKTGKVRNCTATISELCDLNVVQSEDENFV